MKRFICTITVLFVPVFAHAQTLVPPFVSPAIANPWSVSQTISGATTTSPSWCAGLTTDTVPRVCAGLNASDTARLGLGPGGSSARDLFLERAGAANLRLGTSDAASPIAQTLSVQNVVTGTMDGAGANLTINGSQGTGAGAGGSIVFQTAPAGSSGTVQNGLVTAATIDSTGTLTTLGTITTSGALSAGGASQIRWTGRGILTSPAVATVQAGSGDAASPVAQTWRAQSVIAGTSNTAGADWTIAGSRGTGTGVGGKLVFQTAPAGSTGSSQNTFVTALTIAGNSLVSLPAITTDATHTDSTLCQDTTTHSIYFGSGTLGVCLGTSSIRYKQQFTPIQGALGAVMRLRPGTFFYKPGWGDGGARKQIGFLAEDMVNVIPDLVGNDASGHPNSVDIVGIVPLLVKAIQDQQHEIESLKKKQGLIKYKR